jgi:N12 class adenine-specific DNA methylase
MYKNPKKNQPSLFDLPPERVEKPAFVERIAPRPAPQIVTSNVASGEKAKAKDNIAAIRTLHEVERSGKPATQEQREALAKFCGWGPVALSIFPNPVTGEYKEGWKELGQELELLLTEQEYDSAKRTVFNAFYTSDTVISAIHSALDRLGVPENALTLEPGCGVARFMRPGKQYIGVELDSLTSRIAKALHPEADIRNEDFRNTKLPPLDAAIGNVPFADIKHDWKGQKFSLHDYFFAKSVDALKPGGVLALVTSHYTMDKQNASIREHLSDSCDFLGAIRLPSDAFKREGTAVVTDIIFLRKRPYGAPEKHVDYEWKQTAPLEIEGAFIPVNRYFINHPEMVMGNWSRKDTMYGTEGFSVTSNGDLASQLKEAIKRLPCATKSTSTSEAYAATPSKIDDSLRAPVFVPPPPERHISEGSFFVHQGIIHQMIDGQAKPVTYGGVELTTTGGVVGKRMGRLIDLRDKARYVLRSQNEGWPEEARVKARQQLNHAYDAFVSTFGYINKTTFSETKDSTIRRMPNIVKFREDPDAMLVMALEEYDETTGVAKKAPIMLKDVVGKAPPITSVNTAEEGLLVSLDRKGAVDLPFISELYGKPQDTVISELGDLIYRDSETLQWQTSDEYLSGNVRQKLAMAIKAGDERNIEALKAVQPEDVLPGEIDANLGAPWIPVDDIKQFAAHLFQVHPSDINISHLPKEAVWSVEGNWSAERSVAVTTDYGTPRTNGLSLLDLALNMKSPVIYDVIRHADREERVVNQEATLAAKEKQRAIKEHFHSWIFSDPDRTERLVRLYNDTYNNLRPRLFDGSHLDFPGMSQGITLRPHQSDAVWRVMSAGNTLLAHAVGAGKAQPLNAKVLTPHGWRRMGELRVGDEVIAGDGSITTVTGVFPQGPKEVFSLTFTDGGKTLACGDHLWLTQTTKERSLALRVNQTRTGQPKIRTTHELAASIDERHSIPLVGPVQFAKSTLPLDPYTLGVLLGNASFIYSVCRLAVPESVQLDLIKLPDGVYAKYRTTPGTCPEVFLVANHVKPNPLFKILRELNLWGHKSRDKFIPPSYLLGDAQSRLALLQGLMDTDGGMTGRSARFTSYSAKLANDVIELVRSLGGIAYLHVRPGASEGSIRYNVGVSMPEDMCPFQLPRKIAAWNPAKERKRTLKRKLVSVESAGFEECRCISVAHPTQLYVTDDYIVTHNTLAIAASAMKLKQAGLAKKVLCVTPNHLLEQFAREFQQGYPNAKLLVASKDDFTKDRRKYLTAKIASGDWDAIITTHSSFERIGMSKEYQERFLREQIAEYDALLVERATGRDDSKAKRNLIKTIEKQKAARESKLKDLLAEDKKDSGLVFDELGIDHIFVDECFTYDTLIETDRGALKIGDIVTNKLKVSLRTWNKETGVIEWKPIINWYANKRKGPLVKVIHEFGSFICTANHKIWVNEKGYKVAGELEADEALHFMSSNLHDPMCSSQGMPGVLTCQEDAYRAMPMVSEDLRISFARPDTRQQETSSVLLQQMQGRCSEGNSRNRGEVQSLDAKALGQLALQGEEESGRIGMDEGEQIGIFSRNRSENISSIAQEERSSCPARAGRKWETAPDSPVAARRGYRNDDGICDQDESNQSVDGKTSPVLQSGSCRSVEDACRGGGWIHPFLSGGEASGREEGYGLNSSRVVSVKVLEPECDGEYRFGGRDHSVVYDIEVADNHNYFANGVLVSNCHAHKNLEVATKMDRVAGIQTGGSEKAFDLFMKARYLHEKHPGHGVTFASGTPVSNSMVELYTMQRYLDPDGLKARGIDHFDAWAATFGEVVEAMEISPDGKSLKPRSRFAKFVNLPELQQMFRAFADVQTAEMLNLPIPKLQGGKPHVVACPMSLDQKIIQDELVKRYERIRSTKVDPREDNALSITTDGRKLALDSRMVSADAADFEDSKVNRLVENVFSIWERTTPKRSTQMIFCDMGVNETSWGYSAYQDITKKLIAKGIPAGQIANIGDADTDAKKAALFEKMRAGSVRVLLGSTAKLGTGTNVQKRLVALHHLDAPWKPAEVEQRDGRILRQGNENEEVSIYRYVTEGSFDAYMWQALETKAKFINQVMTGESGVRRAEDVGGQELSYAEVKAIASGNPAVLTLAEADAELQRLGVLKRNHADEQYTARRNLRELPQTLDRLEKRFADFTSDAQTIADNQPDLNIEALPKALNRVPDEVTHTKLFPLGKYRGLSFGIEMHPGGAADVYLEGRTFRKSQLSKESRGAKAVSNALIRITGSYGESIERIKQEIQVSENQLQDFTQRLGKEFPHTAYIEELSGLRDRLKLALSAEPKEGEPTTAELADQIEHLRGKHKIEVAAVKPRVEKRVIPVRRKVDPIQPKPEPKVIEDTEDDDDTPPKFTARVGRGGQMALF